MTDLLVILITIIVLLQLLGELQFLRQRRAMTQHIEEMWALLRVWAETWNTDPDQVRRKLDAIVHRSSSRR